MADNGEKLRLILDLRYINKFLQVPKFKCEDNRLIKDLFNTGDFFFKFDICSRYHHVDIHLQYQKYLVFLWIIDGCLRYFVFTVLVFGLSSAPYVFTKILKVLIKHWCSLGMRIFAFIDDGFGWGRSFDKARKLGGFVKSDLFRSGSIAHPVKSQWVLKQEAEHLRYIVNLKEGNFAVPQRRITELQHKLAYFQSSSKATARKLASLAGSIISMGLALGPVVRMWTRAIYRVINSANSRNQKVDLSAEAAHEINFWSECLDQYNGQPIWLINPQIKIVSYSDASDAAWGGYVVHISKSVAKGNFSETEIGHSSTWRELKGTLNVMHSYTDSLKRNTVKHRTDNQNIVWALSASSRKADLHALVIDIYKLCIENCDD